MHASHTPSGERSWSEATQLVTEILDQSATRANEGGDLGKQVSEHVREMFVVCDPAEALRQHFEMGVPPFLALHDLGTGLSREYLAVLARASGWPLRRLHIRKQGFGTLLATLHYIECPATQQRSLRLYASEAEAESSVRVALRRQLLASAWTHALLLEELPEQMAALAIACLRDDLLGRKNAAMSMLVLPQSRAPQVQQQAQALQHVGSVRIEVAPATSAIQPSWALLSTYWNREAAAAKGSDLPMLSRITLDAQPTGAFAPRAHPVPAAAPPNTPSPLNPHDYLTLVMGRTQARAGCVFNVATRGVEAHAGALSAPEMAQQGLAMLMAVARVGDGLALGRSVSEVTTTLGDVQVVIRPTRLRAGCVLMLLLPRMMDTAAWRRAIEQIDAALA